VYRVLTQGAGIYHWFGSLIHSSIKTTQPFRVRTLVFSIHAISLLGSPACDIEDGGEGLGDLDGELDGGGAQLHGRVQAPSVTGIVVSSG
jgi:hypothetical protein